MADNSNNMNSNMCKSNCGFFGNASCDGFCSKCYKDHVKRQNSGSAAGRVTPTSMSSAAPSASSSSIAAAVTAAVGQMNSISEIPVDVTTFIQNAVNNSNNNIINSEPKAPVPASEQSGQMLPPLTVPPVTFTLDTPSVTTSISTTPSVPIAIPARLTAATGTLNAVSVPADLCSTSMASTVGSESFLPSSVEMNNSLTTASSLSGSSVGDLGKTKKRTRCVMDDCKRKVGLTGFDCRCGGLYCWEHRYSDKHNCQFDYKELGQDQIRKNNPIVAGEKISKI